MKATSTSKAYIAVIARIDSGVTTKKVLRRNAFRVGRCYDLMKEVNVIVTFLILVFCLCLSVIAGKLFKQPNGFGKGTESSLGMMFCVALCSFTAIQGAFAPFQQANTALIQCFCEDLDRNDGSPVNPYRAYVAHMPHLTTGQNLSLSLSLFNCPNKSIGTMPSH